MKGEIMRICVIGCGDHANRFVYPSLSALSGVRLAAVCALEAAQAESCRLAHGAGKAYTDYRRMIEEEKPAAVIIIGPPRLHYEAGLFCIEKKLPFYCEKPLGENAAQARELAEKAKAAGVFGQVGFMMRHSAVMREAARLKSGDFEYGVVKYYTSGPYRSDEIYGLPGLDDASFLKRYLLVQAVHPVNLAASFLDEIVEVGQTVQFSEENILVEIKLRDCRGKRCSALLHTFVAPGYGNLKFETELFYADRSMILTDQFHALDYYPPEPSANANVRHWQFAPFGANNVKMGYQSELEYFMTCVREGKQPPRLTTLEDGYQTMSILEKIKL